MVPCEKSQPTSQPQQNPQTQALFLSQSPHTVPSPDLADRDDQREANGADIFCLFALCSLFLRHWCHLGYFVEETHQHSDGSCLVPSAPRHRVPRVTREDCRSCREGCSAGGVSLGNTTIVSLPSLPWHSETFGVGDKGGGG